MIVCSDVRIPDQSAPLRSLFLVLVLYYLQKELSHSFMHASYHAVYAGFTIVSSNQITAVEESSDIRVQTAPLGTGRNRTESSTDDAVRRCCCSAADASKQTSSFKHKTTKLVHTQNA